MARTVEDLHTYLRAVGRGFETADGGTIVLAPSREGQPPVGVRAEDPVVFSVEIGHVPEDLSPEKEVAIYRRLLELNAGDLLYAAYGLRGRAIVLSSAHELSNMDLNEVQAILSDIDLALATHLKELIVLVQGEPASKRGEKLVMGVFARLAQLIQANLNDLISRSEDPEKMLNQVVMEMNSQLINAKKQVAVAIADEKHLAKQGEQEAANAAEWERRAVLAVRQGDDALAKEALSRKKEHDDLAKGYEEQWRKQKAAVDSLKTALRMLNDKIEEAKRKKNVLIARKKRAEAQKAIHETMSGLKDQSAFETFNRMETQIDRMEAEAEAGAELSEEYSGDRLAQKFKEMERTGGADDELLALKRKMGLAPAAPEPVAPPQVRVQTPAAPNAPDAKEQAERDELAAALAEIEAEEVREKERLKRLASDLARSSRDQFSTASLGDLAVDPDDAGQPMTTPASPVHSEKIEALLNRLGVDANHGLSTEQAASAQARDGKNRLPEAPKKPAWKQLAEQFLNPLVMTLIAAAAVAVGVGATSNHGGSVLSRYGDAIAIVLIVVINAVLGLVQERRAEAALEALSKMTAPSARVRRAGNVIEIASEDVVPGDILELTAGDAIVADARLMQTFDLQVEEAALTGESAASSKDSRAIVPDDAPLADRTTMVFLGTNVVRGKARALVTTIGAKTELGRIGAMIASTEKEPTPLERQLDVFGKRVLYACLALSVALFVWGMLRPFVIPGAEPRTWHVLLLEAVSLAVAAIPEGLPAITTITLALGTQRMAKLGAIVRKLPAVETLGAATVICSDKTGTLTQNQMMVREIWADSRAYQVTGQGYDPAGDITVDGKAIDVETMPKTLDHLLKTAALCNDARIEKDRDTGVWKVLGDPTEGALVTLAARGHRDQDAIKSSVRILKELPFDSDRKRMTVITLDASGHEVAHVKGSADVLLPRCVKVDADEGARAITEEDRTTIMAHAERMGSQALRVLALCRRTRGERQPDLAEVDPEDELTFLGLVGMMDPPREGVSEAIAECHHAGIRVVMITGDHKLTATAIAKEIGLWREGAEAVTGTELSAMSDAELTSRIDNISVFARTTAEQKLRIVNAQKAKGHVVAMTGDGVNDAPALKAAHIGIAMGKSGTDVARQAADLVLADDNFATIVAAVREGRAIYSNIKKFIFFLLSSNMGLCVTVFAVSLAGAWAPLTPLMILWINLVTNGLPALALGVDPPAAEQMDERPRGLGDVLLGRPEYRGIAYVGAVMGGLSLVFYAQAATGHEAMLPARALAFSFLAISPLVHAFSCRSATVSVFAMVPLISLPLIAALAVSLAIHLVAVLIPGLRPVFQTFPVTLTEWLTLHGLALLMIPAMELWKLFLRHSSPAPTSTLSTP